jgi:hypothetical protein
MFLALLSLSHAKKRTQSEPPERGRKTYCQNQSSRALRMSCLVFRVLTKTSDGAECGEGEKGKSSYLQPKLVQNASKRTGSGSQATEESRYSTATPDLLGGYTGHDGNFFRSGETGHSVDFSSAWA